MSDRVTSMSAGGLSHPSCITSVPEPITEITAGCPAEGWSSILGPSSGESAIWNMQGGGDLLISFCRFETLTVSLTRASCRGLGKNLSITVPIRQTVKVLVAQSCPALCDSMNYRPPQAPLSMEFSRQEYWGGLPFPSPGNLPNLGIRPGSPALQLDSLLSEPPRKPH